MKINSIVPVLLIALFLSCKKDNNEDAPTPELVPAATKGVELNLKFSVDGLPLSPGAYNYTNTTGNNYSISRLQFYLSDFIFETDSGVIIEYDSLFYIDALNNVNTTFNFDELPYRNYKSLQFFIGLDSMYNIWDAIPNTTENNNMKWPDFMGGGYHFIKLEGNFISGVTDYGYTMHLGKNLNLVTINLKQPFTINHSDHSLRLDMNINEWFTHPYNYNFSVDGSYTMSDSAAMAKLAKNGEDVFSLN